MDEIQKSTIRKLRQRLAANTVASGLFIIAATIWISKSLMVGGALIVAAGAYGMLASRDQRLLSEIEPKLSQSILKAGESIFIKSEKR